MSWVLVTSNENKWREAQRILGRDLERVSLDVPEIQAPDTRAVALAKARAAFEVLRRPVIVEDAGIELGALGGFPGPFIKYWEKLGGLESICRALDGSGNRAAAAVCVLGYCTAENAQVVENRVEDTISQTLRNTNSFGWDAIFIPQGEGRTFGEMTGAEKDERSHRRRAWEALKGRLAAK